MSKKEKIVVFTGAGVSAESGIETFRAETGLWNNHSVFDVCHPHGWKKNPSLVLDFYNARRADIRKAQPNMAHFAIAELEKRHEVHVITQNIDDLHERAGSTNVIHLHGEITKARSDSSEDCTVIDVGFQDTKIGDLCGAGYQLRPHIVWFDEEPLMLNEAIRHFRTANKVLIIGTSLQVYPAAALPDQSYTAKEKVFIVPEDTVPPLGFTLVRGMASSMVPAVIAKWLKDN